MIILTAYMDVPLKVSHKFFPIYLTFNLLDLYIIFLELYLFSDTIIMLSSLFFKTYKPMKVKYSK